MLIINQITSKKQEAEPLELKYDGDIVLENLEHTPPGTKFITTGSITVKEKIKEHASVLLQAGNEIHIGQKIDQHCSVTLKAGSLIWIGEKIDQHCQVELFVGNAGTIRIGQKVDQHSRVWINAPNGTIEIREGVDQHSTVYYFASNYRSRGAFNGSSEFASANPIGEQQFWLKPGPDD